MTLPEKPKILWFDDDVKYIAPFVKALEATGYSVTTARSLTETAAKLDGPERFDMLILDAMITTLSEYEERLYSPADTGRGTATGPFFYKKWKNTLKSKGTIVLALTVRMDVHIKSLFLEAGLPENNFARKVELRKVPTFLKKVVGLLAVSASS